MHKKQDRLFLLLRPPLRFWQTLPALTLLFFDQKADLLPQLRQQIRLSSCFLAVLHLSAKPFSTNFGMTHVEPKRTPLTSYLFTRPVFCRI